MFKSYAHVFYINLYPWNKKVNINVIFCEKDTIVECCLEEKNLKLTWSF